MNEGLSGSESRTMSFSMACGDIPGEQDVVIISSLGQDSVRVATKTSGSGFNKCTMTLKELVGRINQPEDKPKPGGSVLTLGMGWSCSATVQAGAAADRWDIGVTRMDETKWGNVSNTALLWAIAKLVDTPERELEELVASDPDWLTCPAEASPRPVRHNAALDAAYMPLKLSAQREDGLPVEPGTRLFVFRTDLLTEDRTLNADAYLTTVALKAYIREAVRIGKVHDASVALTHLVAGINDMSQELAGELRVTVYRKDNFLSREESCSVGQIRDLESIVGIGHCTGLKVDGVTARF